MKNFKLILFVTLLCSLALEAQVKVVTTLHILADISKQIGGDLVKASPLAGPNQDPHFIQPKPTLIKKARDADLFIEVGLDLELWADKVAESSGNHKIQQAQTGRISASEHISALEVPRNLTRAHGDVHPYGNPHVWLDPINVRQMAKNIAAGLVAVDPGHRVEYRKNLKVYLNKLDTALFGNKLIKKVGAAKLVRLSERYKLIDYLKNKKLLGELGGWLKEAYVLRGSKMITYHKTWVYFAKRFGILIPGEIEEKAGIPPTAKHRDGLIKLIKRDNIGLIAEAVFYNRVAADFIAEKTGARVVVLPIDLGAAPEIKSYFGLIDNIVKKLK